MHRCCLMPRHVMLFAVAAVFIPACNRPDPDPPSPVRLVGDNAWDYYNRARQDLERWELQARSTKDRREAGRRCIRILESAVSVSAAHGTLEPPYACPLFRSRLGWMMLANLAGDLTPAEEAFNLSVDPRTGAIEWVPGWIGLAAWARMTAPQDANRFNDAEGYLTTAEEQLNTLMKRCRSLPDPAALGVFDTLDPAGWSGREEPDPSDPTLPEADRLHLILAWLLTDMMWSEPTPASVGENPPPPLPGIQAVVNVERRMRAWILSERAAIVLARGEHPGAAVGLLTDALEFDPNFAPVQIELAAQLMRLGKHRDSEAILHPFLTEERHRRWAVQPRIQLLAGCLYANWFDAEHWTDAVDKADEHFRATLELESDCVAAYLEHGRLFVSAAKHDPRLEGNADAALEQASECAKQAANLKAPQAEVDALRELIAEARSSRSSR